MVPPSSFDRPRRKHLFRRTLTGALASVAITVALPAGAADPAANPSVVTTPERVQVKYHGPEGCSDRATFVDEVSRRISRPVEWVTENPSLLIEVTLAQPGDHATGELRITRKGTEPSRREFAASSCTEVESALALVVALTLDPNARTEALEPTRRAETPDAPPKAPPEAEKPAPPSKKAAPPAPPQRPKPSRFAAWIGPSLSGATGYAPKPLLFIGGSLGFRVKKTPSSFWAPALELTPMWARTGSTGPQVQAARFTWTMARLTACPTAVSLATDLSLLPCAAGEVGRLSAKGSDDAITFPGTLDRWWAAAGVAVGLHYGRSPWYAEAQVVGLTPITRDEFVYRNPDSVVHQAAVFLPGAMISLGFELEP